MTKSNKNTHTVQQVEKFLYEIPDMIKNARTKEEQRALLKERKRLEQFWNDLTDKEINGKTYPAARMYHSDNKPMDKEEILKLIDSIGTDHSYESLNYECFKQDIDLSGVFIK